MHAVARTVLAAALAAASHALRVELPTGLTWANTAWGFSNGGRDTVEGSKTVLIDVDMHRNASEYIEDLHEAGHIVMCYISAGTLEGFREFYKEDPDAWDGLTLGRMTSFADEEWLDVRQLSRLIPLMSDRFDVMAQAGCDVIEPDNMDCYGSDECGGLMKDLTKAERRALSVEYALILADMAHVREMSIVVKNAIEIYPELIHTFDGAMVENCMRWRECEALSAWTDLNKAVFAVEYDDPKNVCRSHPRGTMVKYCEGNSGAYLCRHRESEWNDCFDPQDPLPITTHVGWFGRLDENSTGFFD